MTYDSALQFCHKEEANLAEVSNADDFQFYRDLLESSGQNATSFWLGHSFDPVDRVWKRLSTNQIIRWKKWKDYNLNEKEPFLASEPFPEEYEHQRNFFCVRHLQKSTHSNVLRGLPRQKVELNNTFYLQDYNPDCRR